MIDDQTIRAKEHFINYTYGETTLFTFCAMYRNQTNLLD